MPARRRRLIASLLFVLLMLGVAAGGARAQDYPTHAVRLISDSAPGSAIDAEMGADR
jgi:tripartite-type tricarboxylate transporter receptor subunit TctC